MSLAIDSRHPDGLDEANVALTTKVTLTMVTYHLRGVVQFLGFSISPGAKSRWPVSFRYRVSVALKFFERYGFATGLERMRSSFSMLDSVDDGESVFEMQAKNEKEEVKERGK